MTKTNKKNDPTSALYPVAHPAWDARTDKTERARWHKQEADRRMTAIKLGIDKELTALGLDPKDIHLPTVHISANYPRHYYNEGSAPKLQVQIGSYGHRTTFPEPTTGFDVSRLASVVAEKKAEQDRTRQESAVRRARENSAEETARTVAACLKESGLPGNVQAFQYKPQTVALSFNGVSQNEAIALAALLKSIREEEKAKNEAKD